MHLLIVQLQATDNHQRSADFVSAPEIPKCYIWKQKL